MSKKYNEMRYMKTYKNTFFLQKDHDVKFDDFDFNIILGFTHLKLSQVAVFCQIYIAGLEACYINFVQAFY